MWQIKEKDFNCSQLDAVGNCHSEVIPVKCDESICPKRIKNIDEAEAYKIAAECLKPLDIYVNKDTAYRHQQTADRVATALISVSQQSEMTWTKEMPTQPGDYRAKENGCLKIIIQSWEDGGKLYCSSSHHGGIYLFEKFVKLFNITDWCFIPMPESEE